MQNKINTLIKLTWIIVPVLVITGCKTNNLLHKNITKDNWKDLVECKKLTDCDTIRFDDSTVGIKIYDDRIAVGDIVKGRKTGKWYYYFVYDTIHCYKTETYKKRDTIVDNIIRYRHF